MDIQEMLEIVEDASTQMRRARAGYTGVQSLGKAVSHLLEAHPDDPMLAGFGMGVVACTLVLNEALDGNDDPAYAGLQALGAMLNDKEA